MRNGAEILLQCLLDHGVDVAFAYPGGATLPIHQALTRVSDRLRVILPRHEQGGGFAAIGYARSSGKVGVCFATSGPGATNLVTCLADAQRHAVPLLAITGQVARPVLGTDAFQEIPIVSVCRSITKHHYLVTRAEDIPRVVDEALHVATSGRPGPVLVDVPKDLQARRFVPDATNARSLPGYRPEAWNEVSSVEHPVHRPATGPAAIVARLWHLLRERSQLENTYLTTSIGLARSWVRGAYRFPSPRHWIDSHSLGAIGFALPAALGVQVAHPEKQVIAVDTAESFLSNVQELACAHCEKLPVKVLLIGQPSYADLSQLARGFGVTVVTAGNGDESLAGLLDTPGPLLLDATVREEAVAPRFAEALRSRE